MRSLVRFLVINLAVGLFPVLILLAGPGSVSFERARFLFCISFAYSSVISGLSWLVLPRAAVRIRGNSFWRWVQLSLLLALLGFSGGSLVHVLLSWQPFFRITPYYWSSITTCVLITLGIGSVTYIVEEAKAKLQSTTLQLRTRELERERAVRAAAQAQLESLESRIHPHFLFNTLNSISALVRQDPVLAEELIGRLAALLRYSLDRQGRLVPLEEELKITRDYLEIEKARFQDRLTFDLAVPPELLPLAVPALSIQTLVENSVKYAVGAQRQGAHIQVTAARTTEKLRVAVADTGPGFSPEACPAGHGLDTLRQRLEASFGAQAALLMHRTEPGMEVAMEIPC